VVNASLNWASIVGIVLAVGGALLYFMRSFKPALARDYDVFFAAVGLLCGGILFFQGWRLDPILQFGQFLLAGTTVFFAYESVRLRGVTTEQARRSSYFDDDEPMPEPGPYRPRMGGRAWGEGSADRFDEPEPLRRRIPSRGESDGADEEDFYRAPRPSSRAAIPERAASRRPAQEDWTPQSSSRPSIDFGARRRDRDAAVEPRRGSRPTTASEAMPRSSRRPTTPAQPPAPAPEAPRGSQQAGVPQGSPISPANPASGRSNRPAASDISDADFTPVKPSSRPEPSPRGISPRDNSSRFDD
jgi:hypothetical protein